VGRAGPRPSLGRGAGGGGHGRRRGARRRRLHGPVPAAVARGRGRRSRTARRFLAGTTGARAGRRLRGLGRVRLRVPLRRSRHQGRVGGAPAAPHRPRVPARPGTAALLAALARLAAPPAARPRRLGLPHHRHLRCGVEPAPGAPAHLGPGAPAPRAGGRGHDAGAAPPPPRRRGRVGEPRTGAHVLGPPGRDLSLRPRARGHLLRAGRPERDEPPAGRARRGARAAQSKPSNTSSSSSANAPRRFRFRGRRSRSS